MVQWLGPCPVTAKGPRVNLGQGTKIPQAILLALPTPKKSLAVSLIEKLKCMDMCDANEFSQNKDCFSKKHYKHLYQNLPM